MIHKIYIYSNYSEPLLFNLVFSLFCRSKISCQWISLQIFFFLYSFFAMKILKILINIPIQREGGMESLKLIQICPFLWLPFLLLLLLLLSLLSLPPLSEEYFWDFLIESLKRLAVFSCRNEKREIEDFC